MERRNTIQKEIIKDAIVKMRSHVSADDVYEYINKDHPSIGKGTVYRNLNILSQEGEIRKVEVPDGPDCFDFTLENHYHCKCMKCQRIFDVDMEEINLMDKINDTHGFKFISYDIFFKGICKDCEE